MLWLMFLACMATSVFFSFDSFFTAIFPQSERVRAAELRAQNQVSGIVADIEQAIAARRASLAEDAVHDRRLEGLRATARNITKAADPVARRHRALRQRPDRRAPPRGQGTAGADVFGAGGSGRIGQPKDLADG